jgi:phosphoribosylamine--glycine ligase
MAKFLIVSCLGESVGLAIRLMAEGHEVLYYIHEKAEADCGDGFLNKVDDWRDHIEEADVVFFDDLDQKHKGETAYKSSAWSLEVREKYPDKLVIGGGHPDVAKLENDRMFAQEIMQQYGIPTVPMERFTSFADARKFIEENGGGWALKHNSQVDRDLAHVSKDPEDMIEFLDWLEKNWKDLGNGQPVDFVLQQAVDGIEFAVTAFFDGQHFRSEACYLNQEEKKELNGGNGRSTGQMGEIGFVVPNARLFQETLAKIEPFLQDKQYIGWADCNCIVAGPNQVVPLEFTIARPGYPTLYSWCELLAEPVGDWLIRMAQGDQAPIRAYPAINCTVVIATGTFPDQHPTRNKLAIIHGLDRVGLRHVWLAEAHWEDGKVYGAGEMGYLAVVTAKGNTIPEAAANAYKIVDEIEVVPYKKIRTDIGERAMQEFPQLYQWNWLS